MIAYYATLKVKPEHGPEFERIVTALKELVSRHEPDVLLYQLCRSRGQPGVYHMLELYRDQSARDRHESTAYYLEAAPRFAALLTDDMRIEQYDAL